MRLCICYGQLVSTHKTWASALAINLGQFNSQSIEILVQNASHNGNTTRQALERIHYDVTSHNPDYVLIQFGMNDCNYWQTDNGCPRVSVGAFSANIEEIVNKCSAAGVKHCFIATNHPSSKDSTSRGNQFSYDESNTRYNAAIRETFYRLLEEKADFLTLCDYEQVWTRVIASDKSVKLENFLLADGIHLSEQGHELYASSTAKIILNKIKETEAL